jgi:predicted PurR-regulated permease PerM
MASWPFLTEHEHADPEASAARPTSSRVGQALLAIIALIVVGGALKLTASVTLPLAFALFLAAVCWPLQHRLEERMPRGVALALTLAILLAVLLAFAGTLWFSATIVARDWPQYASQFQNYMDQARNTAQQYGISLPGGAQSEQSATSTLQPLVLATGQQVFTFVGGMVLVTGFLIFGLLEAHDFRARLEEVVPSSRSGQWFAAIKEITHSFQRYIVVRTVIGLITGVLVALVSWLIGLDFAIIWGLSNFLLNYIPTLGSIIAVVPPVLFALLQFQSIEMALLVLLGVGGAQFLMGQYIDPWLQGKYLDLSPLVVLFSVTFWGWLWGVAGAFISVPLTMLIVIACNQFDRTRWVATLLADMEPPTEDKSE